MPCTWLHGLDGLGQDAEDFRAAKSAKASVPGKPHFSGQMPGNKRAHGVAFGSGVLDEDDTYGMMDDYVTTADNRSEFAFEEAAEDEHVGSGLRCAGLCVWPI